jgi:predicted membrane GTPase involved in stress response
VGWKTAAEVLHRRERSYQGMIIGEHSRDNDPGEVNPLRVSS